MRSKVGADRRAKAEHGAVDNCLTIEGVGNRLPHQNVVERRARIVDGQDGFAFSGTDHHGEPVIGAERIQRFGRGEIRESINIA